MSNRHKQDPRPKLSVVYISCKNVFCLTVSRSKKLSCISFLQRLEVYFSEEEALWCCGMAAIRKFVSNQRKVFWLFEHRPV